MSRIAGVEDSLISSRTFLLITSTMTLSFLVTAYKYGVKPVVVYSLRCDHACRQIYNQSMD